MADNCQNCKCKGDMGLCSNTPCYCRESWWAKEIQFKLSRYEGGVEVKGRISKVGQWQPSDGWDTICDRFLGQRVKILVMKEEV